MVSVEDAWRAILEAVAPLPPVEVSLSCLLGLVLAQDVRSGEDAPAFRSSAMDGFAVIAGSAEAVLRVAGEQDAGLITVPSLPGGAMAPGTAVRIMTGAVVPEGADAVVPVEFTEEHDGQVRLLRAVRPGENVRPIGQDLAAGDLVVEAGSVIGPAEIGLLATLGRTRLLAHRRPRLAVLATGDELVSPEDTPSPGQIRDSNSAALLAAAQAAGAEAVCLGRARDQEDELRAAILEGLASRDRRGEADVLLTSGGVSMGRRDLVKPLLAELGSVRFGRVAMRPGKPLTFAMVRSKPVFGLPGFPVSSLVSFELFVRPALRRMAGFSKLWRPQVRARLGHAIRHPEDRTEFQRAVVRPVESGYLAETTGLQASSRLKSLVGANALLRLPAGQADFAPGDEVVAMLTDMPEVD
jgi:molybdopterin molybdotransferase